VTGGGVTAAVAAPERNWSRTLAFSAAVHQPSTLAELQRAVAGSSRVHALGSRHSFTPVADTTGTLLSLARLPAATDPTAIEIDADRRLVRVPAGVRYGQLARQLEQAGFALHNLGSLPHISVVGAVSTGTHGSGPTNGNLATAVRAVELVTASGDIRTLDRGSLGERFDGAVVALGCLGIVTAVTLAVEPTYLVCQDVYADLSFDAFAENTDVILGAGYSVSLFTDFAARSFPQVWVKRRLERGIGIDAPEEFFGARRLHTDVHPIPGMSPEPTTAQCGAPGPWSERLAHFTPEFQPGFGAELQSEHFVARADVVSELEVLFALADTLGPLTRIAELRTTAADRLWLSPQYSRDTAGVSFTWSTDEPAVHAALVEIERALAPLDPRPHWGKLFATTPARLAAAYPRLPDFRALAAEFDPTGKFRNSFSDTFVWAGAQRND
jgi:xylitol oxidase